MKLIATAITLLNVLDIAWCTTNPFSMGPLSVAQQTISLTGIFPVCPSGYQDYGLTCMKYCDSGWSTWNQFTCSQNCASGYEEIGDSCTKAGWCSGGFLGVGYPCADVYFRKTYARAHAAKQCESNKLFIAGLCFPNCPIHYSIKQIGDTVQCLWNSNTFLFSINSAIQSAKKVIEATSCYARATQGLSGFLTGSMGWDKIIAAKDNPQSIYPQYKAVLEEFRSCAASAISQPSSARRLLGDRQLLATNPGPLLVLEFGVSIALGVDAYAAFGVIPAIDPTQQPAAYWTWCIGGVSDLSAGFYFGWYLYKDYNSIPGESGYVAIGGDAGVPAAMSFDGSMVVNSGGVIAGGIIVGAEAGLSPLDIGGGRCMATWL